MPDPYHLELGHVLTFALSYMLVAVAPGPNFMLVSAIGISSARVQALLAAIGIALGACLLYLSVTLGADILLANAAVRKSSAVVFGGYLIYLAFRSWNRTHKGATKGPLRDAEQRPGCFRIAFLTALANPGTAIFFASSHFLMPRQSPFFVGTVAIVIFAIAVGWFGIVAVTVSSRHVRALLTRRRGWLDVAFAATFLFYGVTTIASGLNG